MGDETLCQDPAVLNLWHPISAENEISEASMHSTLLLGHTVAYGRDGDGAIWVRATEPEVRFLPTQLRHGYVWTSLGDPTSGVFDIPETREPDRRSLNAGSVMVATSAPRVIENFLDMGHFPFVHAGLLGAEPHTEVADYDAKLDDGEIWARECWFHQPVAAPSASAGQVTEYTYRVPHPYCVMLFKSVPTDPSRRDVVALFAQAMTDRSVRAHNYLCVVDDASSDNELKRFQQMIFFQDKPVLENQLPKCLPLDPRIETPIRADRSAIVYRRWLTELGLTYSVIPAA